MSFKENAERNRRLPCRVPGCATGRAALSPLCALHAQRACRYGSPHGRSIRSKEYLGERKQAEAFIEKHSKHPAIVAAEQFLADWLQAAAQGDRVPGAADFARLAAHGVMPRRILVEVIAVYLLSRSRPSTLPDDARLTFAIGNRVLLLAPLERRFGTLKGHGRYYSRGITKTARRAVGDRLRTTLAALLGNVEAALIAEHVRSQEFVARVRQPFTSGTQ